MFQASAIVIAFPKQSKLTRKKHPKEQCSVLEWLRNDCQFPDKKPKPLPPVGVPPSSPTPAPPVQPPPKPSREPQKPGEKGGAE